MTFEGVGWLFLCILPNEEGPGGTLDARRSRRHLAPRASPGAKWRRLRLLTGGRGREERRSGRRLGWGSAFRSLALFRSLGCPASFSAARCLALTLARSARPPAS